MKCRLKISILMAVFASVLSGQSLNKSYFEKNVEVYFSLPGAASKSSQLSELFSIANVRNDTVFGYANYSEYLEIIKSGLHPEILPHPVFAVPPKMTETIADTFAWDAYPTYPAYVSYMEALPAKFPGLVRVYDAGRTVKKRKILFAVISARIDSTVAEPRLMYTSTMHGNETVGYVLTLRLIDYLLSNYGLDSKVTNLMEKSEIWINPLANPDGAFYAGDSTISGAMRYNANGYDLNRNFPDILLGQNVHEQPETSAMRALAEEYHFVISANFHAGAEVVNYPWDRIPELHSDDSWFERISKQYADTAQINSPDGYFTFLGGYTNGYQWYTAPGTRQDYMTYYMHTRETTIELSNEFLLPENKLREHWDYNYRSLINYLEQGLYGIHGRVVDSSGNPITAKIEIVGHDTLGSEVYSDSAFGAFYRPIASGSYELRISAQGFFTKQLFNITAADDSVSELMIVLNEDNKTDLSQDKVIPDEFYLSQNYPNPFNPTTTIEFGLQEAAQVRLAIFNVLGERVAELVNGEVQAGYYRSVWDGRNALGSAVPSGIYFFRAQISGVTGKEFTEVRKMILMR